MGMQSNWDVPVCSRILLMHVLASFFLFILEGDITSSEMNLIMISMSSV